MADLVSFVNKDGMVSSKLVAEKFGKRHKNVLNSVYKLKKELPNDFYKLCFKPVENTGEIQRGLFSEVLMSRDGFSLLAMGFTGKSALAWKVRFIEAFNTLENETPKLLRRIKELEHNEQLRITSDMEKRARSESRKGFITAYLTPMFEAFDNALGIVPRTISLPRSTLTDSEIALHERIHCSHRLKGVSEELIKREKYEQAILAWERLTPEQRNSIPRPERASFGLRP